MSSVAFLLLAYLFKYRSMWQVADIKRRRDIWRMKDIDDFLNYVKFEYKNFCLIFTMVLFDYMLWAYYGDPDSNYKLSESAYFRVLMILAINRFVSLSMLLLQLK